jgi:hypothetical protein
MPRFVDAVSVIDAACDEFAPRWEPALRRLGGPLSESAPK